MLTLCINKSAALQLTSTSDCSYDKVHHCCFCLSVLRTFSCASSLVCGGTRTWSLEKDKGWSLSNKRERMSESSKAHEKQQQGDDGLA